MIKYVHGILSDITENYIVVEAGGLGYGICVPGSLSGKLPPVGSEVRIYTCFSVREDGQTLYGFLTTAEREMFLKLIGVSGVGPKGALAVMTALSPDDLRMAIVTGDAKAISRAQGIGARTAQRIILDLKDKIDPTSVFGGEDMASGAVPGPVQGGSSPADEAADALEALGYSRIEAVKAVRKVPAADAADAGSILRAALKFL